MLGRRVDGSLSFGEWVVMGEERALSMVICCLVAGVSNAGEEGRDEDGGGEEGWVGVSG